MTRGEEARSGIGIDWIGIETVDCRVRFRVIKHGQSARRVRTQSPLQSRQSHWIAQGSPGQSTSPLVGKLGPLRTQHSTQTRLVWASLEPVETVSLHQSGRQAMRAQRSAAIDSQGRIQVFQGESLNPQWHHGDPCTHSCTSFHWLRVFACVCRNSINFERYMLACMRCMKCSRVLNMK